MIIGHGDLMLAECCEPELTTVNLHVPQLCSVAVSNLMLVLQGQVPAHQTTIAGDLHVRDTTIGIQG